MNSLTLASFSTPATNICLSKLLIILNVFVNLCEETLNDNYLGTEWVRHKKNAIIPNLNKWPKKNGHYNYVFSYVLIHQPIISISP